MSSTTPIGSFGSVTGSIPTMPVVTSPGSGYSPEVQSFLNTLENLSVETEINVGEANQGITLFRVVNLVLAGYAPTSNAADAQPDVLGVLGMFYGFKDKEAFLRKLSISSDVWLRLVQNLGNGSGTIRPAVQAELGDLRRQLEMKELNVRDILKEAKRQFNLGLSTDAVGNVEFPRLFMQYVTLANDPILNMDIAGEDKPGGFTDKEKIGRAYDLLRDLKGVILRIVRSLSKYGSLATRDINEPWAAFEARAMNVLNTIAQARTTGDDDDKNAWSILAEVSGRNRETEVAPHVVLARDGGKLLELAMEAYNDFISGGDKKELSSYDRTHLLRVFQKQSTTFLASRMRDRAALVDRYRLQAWA